MPLIKSAIKKLRQDKKRTLRNRGLKKRYKELTKKALSETADKSVRAAVSAIDKAAKRHVIHKNKAARLKSRVMKAKKVKPKPGEKEAGKTKPKKKFPPKPTKKKRTTKIDREKTKK